MTDNNRAERIRVYWRERGYRIDAGVCQCVASRSDGRTYPYQAVRSDLIDGLPVGYRGEMAVGVWPKRRAQ